MTTYKIRAAKRQFSLSCAMRCAALVVLCAVTACSNSSHPPGGGGDMSGGVVSTDMAGQPTVKDACLMVDTARQAARLTCSGVTQSYPLIVYDAADCARQQRAADAGYVTLDAAELPKCLAAIQAASCTTLALGELPECVALYVPLSAIGAGCLDARDCKSGSTCHNSMCPGTCEKLAGVGEPCGVGCAPPLVCDTNTICQQPATQGMSCATSNCVAGQYCDFNGGNPICRALKPAGSLCQTGTGECQAPLVCVSSMCALPPKLGESCASARCEFGLACDDATKKCVVWRDDNGVCHGEFECSPDFICTTPGGGNGTCVKWLDAGATCDPAVYRCRMPTVCSSGTCKMTSSCT